MNSIHFTILLLLVALLCDEGISGVPSDIFNFRNYATNLSSARFPVGSDDCSNCLHTQSARFHVDYLLEDEDVDNGCRYTENDVLCSLFLFRKVSPSSGCLPLSFRVPWLLFHMEHTFLSSPPASSLPSPSRNQCRAERRNKTAI